MVRLGVRISGKILCSSSRTQAAASDCWWRRGVGTFGRSSGCRRKFLQCKIPHTPPCSVCFWRRVAPGSTTLWLVTVSTEVKFLHNLRSENGEALACTHLACTPPRAGLQIMTGTDESEDTVQLELKYLQLDIQALQNFQS